MNLFCQSIDFRNCPDGVPRQLVLDVQRQKDFLYFCNGQSEISDALVLNTCNRLEFYFYARRQFDVSAVVDNFILCNCWNERKRSFCGFDAVGHLFNVAAGIESQIVGENEIFSQLKSAYSLALGCECVNSTFHRLLHSAFRVAKAVRANTGISTGALSVAQAAVEVAASNFAIERAKVLVLGAGSNAELIVKHLIKKNVCDITVAARNKCAAECLIGNVGVGYYMSLEELYKYVADFDVVFTATTSQQPLIKAADIKNRIKPVIMVDISVPANVESEAGDISGVKLFNIGSLKDVIRENNRRRQIEIPKAKAIIEEHLRLFSRRCEDLKAAVR